MDSFACNYEDHPVTHCDGRNVTAVELVALHHAVAVDPLHWFADFAMEKQWFSPDAVYSRSCRG